MANENYTLKMADGSTRTISKDLFDKYGEDRVAEKFPGSTIVTSQGTRPLGRSKSNKQAGGTQSSGGQQGTVGVVQQNGSTLPSITEMSEKAGQAAKDWGKQKVLQVHEDVTEAPMVDVNGKPVPSPEWTRKRAADQKQGLKMLGALDDLAENQRREKILEGLTGDENNPGKLGDVVGSTIDTANRKAQGAWDRLIGRMSAVGAPVNIGTAYAVNRETSRVSDPDAMAKIMQTQLAMLSQSADVDDAAKEFGMDRESFVKEVLKPRMGQILHNKLVEMHTPKGTADYILNNFMNGSIPGMIMNMTSGQSASDRKIQQEGLSHYNPSAGESLLGMGVNTISELPVYAATEGAAAFLSKGIMIPKAMGLVRNGMKLGEAVERTMLAQSGTALGFASRMAGSVGNFATLNTINSITNQMNTNGKVDWSQVGSSAAEAIPLGIALGSFGHMMQKAGASAIGRQVPKTIMYGSDLVGRASIMTGVGLGSEYLKDPEHFNLDKQDIGAQFMQNLYMNMGFDIIGGVKRMSKNIETGGWRNAFRGFMDAPQKAFKITNDEISQLNENGIQGRNAQEVLENITRMCAGKNSQEKVTKFLQDTNISEELKGKVLALTTGQGNYMAPSIGANVVEKDGKFVVEELNPLGLVNKRTTFSNEDAANSYAEKARKAGTDNQRKIYEGLYESMGRMKNVDTAVYQIANISGKSVDEVMKIWTKGTSKGEGSLTEAEKDIYRRVNHLYNGNDSRAVFELDDMKRIAEKICDLDTYDLDSALKKSPKDRTEKEQKAVDYYVEQIERKLSPVEADAKSQRLAGVRVYYKGKEGVVMGLTPKGRVEIRLEDGTHISVDNTYFASHYDEANRSARIEHDTIDIVPESVYENAKQDGASIFADGDPDEVRRMRISVEETRQRLVDLIGEDAVKRIDDFGVDGAFSGTEVDRETAARITEYVDAKETMDAYKAANEAQNGLEHDAAVERVDGMRPEENDDGVQVVRVMEQGGQHYVIRHSDGELGKGNRVIATPVDMKDGKLDWTTYDEAKTVTLKQHGNENVYEVAGAEIEKSLAPNYSHSMDIMGDREPSVGLVFQSVDRRGQIAVNKIVGQDPSGNWNVQRIEPDGSAELELLTDDEIRTRMDQGERAAVQGTYDMEFNRRRQAAAEEASRQPVETPVKEQTEKPVQGNRGEEAASVEEGTNNAPAPYELQLSRNEDGTINYEESPVEATVQSLKERTGGTGTASGFARNKVRDLTDKFEKTKKAYLDSQDGTDIDKIDEARQAHQKSIKELEYWQKVDKALAEESRHQDNYKKYSELSEKIGSNIRYARDDDEFRRIYHEITGKEMGEGFMNGIFLKAHNTIILNGGDSYRANTWILGHETGHKLANEAKEHWFDFREAVLDTVDKEWLESEIKRQLDLYSDETKGMSDDEAREYVLEEIVNDQIGNIFQDPEKMKRLIKGVSDAMDYKNSNIVYRKMIDVWNGIKYNLPWSKEPTSVDKAVDALRDAIVTAEEANMQQQQQKEHQKRQKNQQPESKKVILSEKTADGSTLEVTEDKIRASYESRKSEQRLLDAMYKTNAGKWAKSDLEDMRKVGDSMMEGVLPLMAKHPAFQNWNERMVLTDKKGNPVYSVFIKNQDTTAPTIELSRNCVKKEAMNNLLTVLRREGNLDKLDNISYLDLREILKKHGYSIACEMCYIESKRENVEAKKRLGNKWNMVADAIGIDRDFMENDGETTLTPEQRNTLNKIIEDEKIWAATHKGTKYNDERSASHSSVARIAQLMLDYPELAGRMDSDSLFTPDGWNTLLKKFDDNHPLMKFLASHDGSGTAKPTFGSQVFSQQKFMQQYADLKRYFGEAGIEFGGFRKHSFSDADPLLFVDDYQIHENLALTKSGMFGYTKVPYYVDMWGETGEFINQSLVVDIDTEAPESRKYAGLIKVGDPRHQKALGMTDAEYEQYKEENSLSDGDWDYYFADESFPADKAFKFRKDGRFNSHVGNVIVAPSDECIWHALDDPRIDVIIGWHSSSKMVNAKERTGYDHATDYGGKYNTNETKGNTESTFSNNFLPEMSVVAPVELKGNGYHQYVDFNFNAACQEFGDAKIAADAYLEWCSVNGFTPKYEKFSGHENYYKLLADFRRYDADGNPLIQGAVQMRLPEDWATKLDGYLEQREREYKQNTSGITEDASLMADVHKALGIKEADSRTLAEERGTHDAAFKDTPLTLAKKRGINESAISDGKGTDSLSIAQANEEKLSKESVDEAARRKEIENSLEFKRWFEGSKVVNEDGSPIVVYHGSHLQEMYTKDGHLYTRPVDRFNTFSENTGYFTDNRDAARKIGGSERGMYACYLDIKNPLIIDANGKQYDEIELSDELKEKLNIRSKTTTTDKIVDEARYIGDYDGVIFKNVIEPDGGKDPITDYKPFSPNQIKSAEIETRDDEGNVISSSRRFDSSNNDIRFSKEAAKIDSDYRSAVESGDVEKQKEVVKRAAKIAMPDTKIVDADGNPLVVYHGTRSGGFTVFDLGKGYEGKGLFTVYKQKDAQDYSKSDDFVRLPDFKDGDIEGALEWLNDVANRGTGEMGVTFSVEKTKDEDGDDAYVLVETERSGGRRIVDKTSIQYSEEDMTDFIKDQYNNSNDAIYPVFLNIKNPLVIDAKSSSWREIEYNGSKRTTDSIVKEIKDSGEYDGLIIKNVYDSWSADGIVDEAIALYPEQAKIADPVTYDDRGNVIPISKRFDFSNDDVRFSKESNSGQHVENNSSNAQKNAKNVVPLQSDNQAWLSPEARQRSLEKHKDDKDMARKDIAFLSDASREGVKFDYETLMGIPEIAEAQAKLDANKDQHLEISEDEAEKHVARLFDADHGSFVEKVKDENGKSHEIFTGEVEQGKKAFIVIGRPAGGKSSVFANPLSHDNKARIIDSDTVKPWLDGYDDGDGAGYVQDASDYVATRALAEAIKRGDNIVLPKIGGNTVLKMALSLVDNGYTVSLHYNDVPEEVSMTRSAARFAETGRFLSQKYLRSIGEKPRNIFGVASGSVEDVLEYLAKAEIEDNKENHTNITKYQDRLKDYKDEQRIISTGQADALQPGSRVRLSGLDEGADARTESASSEQTQEVDRLFDYLEWLNNDVPYKADPIRVWDSNQDKPLPPSGGDGNKSGERRSREDEASTTEKQKTWRQRYNEIPKDERMAVTDEAMRRGGDFKGSLEDYESYRASKEEQEKREKGANFKKFFGDWENDPENASKVVDENGRPLVLSHGTPFYGFTEFRTAKNRWGDWTMGAHFGSREAAEDRLDTMGSRADAGEKGIYDVYLNIRKPWECTDWFDQDDPYAMTDLAKLALENKDNAEVQRLWQNVKSWEPWAFNYTDEQLAKGDQIGKVEGLESWANDEMGELYANVRRMVQAAGYDGIKYYNDAEGEGYSWVAFKPNQIKSAETEGMMANNGNFDAGVDDIRCSREERKDVLDKLNNEKTIKVYRAIRVDDDGTLNSPMAGGGVGGKKKADRVPLYTPEFGVWEKADEHPELATYNDGDEYGHITIDKGEGKGSLKVAYNPYIHTSRQMLNDQFSGAWQRNNLKVVEVEIPESELTSGYRADMAKNSVGETEWKAGVVAKQLPEGKRRKVILTRWDKPVRIVPVDEYAKAVKEQLSGTDIEGIPFNCVTPEQRDALAKEGIKILPPEKSAGAPAMEAYNEWMNGGDGGPDGGVRFSKEDKMKENEWKTAIQSFERVSHAEAPDRKSSSSTRLSGANLKQIDDITKSLASKISEIDKNGGFDSDFFFRNLKGSFGLDNSDNEKSEYKNSFVTGDGSKVTVRISNHHARALNFILNHSNSPINVGVVISSKRTEFKPNKDVNYIELYYFGDEVDKNADLQKSIVNGLSNFVNTGSISDMPVPDLVKASGDFRSQWENAKKESNRQAVLDGIKQAIADTDVNPTEAQKKSGNYRMGHARLDGYELTIENPAGSVRRGTDANGNHWETKMNNTYGYIRGTRGVDGDHIDIFLSEDPTSGNVYVVDQIDPETGKFDEHKVMYGFDSADEAKEAYLSNYEKGWNGLGEITEVSKEEFKKWVDSSVRKTKPFAEYKSVTPIEERASREGETPERPVRRVTEVTSDGRVLLSDVDKRRRTKEWKTAIKEMADDRDAVNILLDDEEHDIYEAAATVLSRGGILWETEGHRKGVKAMLGWSNGERKKMFQLFKKGGKSLEMVGDEIISWCNQQGIPYDQDDAMAGTNAAIEVLQQCTTAGDVVHYMDHVRVSQAEAEHETFVHDRDMYYQQTYGMDYETWKEKKDEQARVEAERKRKGALDGQSENWYKKRIQRQRDMIVSLESKISKIQQDLRSAYGPASYAKGALRARDKSLESYQAAYRKLKEEVAQGRADAKSLENYRAAFNEIKEVKKQMVDFVKEQLSSENMPYTTKRDLNRLLSQIVNTNTLDQMQHALTEVRGIAGLGETRHLESRLNKLLNMRVVDYNGRNMSIAKTVDDRTRRIVENIKKRVSDVMISGLEEERESKIRDRRLLRGEINTLETELADTNDEDRVEEIRSEIEQKEKQWSSMKDEIIDIEGKINDIRAGKGKQSIADVDKEISDLEEKLNKSQEDGHTTWTDQDTDTLTALKIMQQMNDAHANGSDVIELDKQIGEKIGEIKALREKLDGADELQRRNIRGEISMRQNELEAIQNQRASAIEAHNESLAQSVQNMEDLFQGGRNALRQRVEAEVMRRMDILRNVFHEIRGKKVDVGSDKMDEKDTFWNSAKKVFTTPINSFDYLCQTLGRRVLGPDSYLYRHFMKGKDGVMEAYNTEQRGLREQKDLLNKKVDEIFGSSILQKGAQGAFSTDRWTQLAAESDKVESGKVHFTDPESGVVYDKPMSKGQAMYVYMAWKQEDGRNKLINQGVTPETIQEIKDYIGKKYMDLADWIQDEFLVNSREKYNERYVEIYNTSLARIPNYVPLRVNKRAVHEDGQLSENNSSVQTLNAKTGSLINRRVNILPLDVTASAFDVISEHVAQMENFYAYARVRKDLDGLWSSNYFRNQLDTNAPGTSQLWNEATRVATQMYTPQDKNWIDRSVGRLNKGLVSGNIAWRFNTALKQLLSAPAYLGYTADPTFLAFLTKNSVTGIIGANLKWSSRHLPSFRARVDLGNIGDNRINEKIGETWLDNALDKYTQLGMVPNRLIDAITCSIGTRSIYDYEIWKRHRLLKKMKFDSDADRAQAYNEAERMALMEADIFYNATQQSSHPAFLSPMQLERTMMARATTTYQNSNLGYTRKMIEAANDLRRSTKFKELQKNYTEDIMHELGYKAHPDDTFDGKEWEWDVYKKAKSDASARIISQTSGNMIRLALFGLGMKWAWNWGSKGLLGLFQGNDDDEKKKKDGETDEEYKDRMDKRAYHSWGEILTMPMQGTPGGNMLISANDLAFGDGWGSKFSYNPFLILGEAEEFGNDVSKASDDYGWVSAPLALTIMDHLGRLRGVNFETLGNIYFGIEGMVKDGHPYDDKMIDLMYILNTPKTGRAAAARELYKDDSEEEYMQKVALAERYLTRATLLPEWTTWMKGKMDDKEAKKLQDEYNELHPGEYDSEDEYYKSLIAPKAKSNQAYSKHAKTIADYATQNKIKNDTQKYVDANKAFSEIKERKQKGEYTEGEVNKWKRLHKEDLDGYTVFQYHNARITKLKQQMDGGPGDDAIMEQIRIEWASLQADLQDVESSAKKVERLKKKEKKQNQIERRRKLREGK